MMGGEEIMIKHKTDEGKGMNTMAKALTGAAVAGIVAGAVALRDEKNREKVKKLLKNVKDQMVEKKDEIQAEADHKKQKYGKELKKQVEDKKAELKVKLKEGREAVKDLEAIAKKAEEKI